MMYKSNFVAVVKCNGKITRELGDEVRLPFGSEYSLLLKNLNTTKAVVSVEVDGKDVLNGHQLIIDPGKESELEGFMDGLRVSHKFKFIEKTAQISEYRGDRVDDGHIRITYQFEEKPAVIEKITTVHDQWYRPRPNPWYDYPCYKGGLLRGFSDEPTLGTRGSTGSKSEESLKSTYSLEDNGAVADFCCDSDTTPPSHMMAHNNGLRGLNRESKTKCAVPKSEDGITVKGSSSNQNFRVGYVSTLEAAKHVINLVIKGKTQNDEPVKQVLTVSEKLSCETCGTKSRSDKKFCANCGTAIYR